MRYAEVEPGVVFISNLGGTKCADRQADQHEGGQSKNDKEVRKHWGDGWTIDGVTIGHLGKVRYAPLVRHHPSIALRRGREKARQAAARYAQRPASRAQRFTH
jgi:hypothetical protein